MRDVGDVLNSRDESDGVETSEMNASMTPGSGGTCGSSFEQRDVNMFRFNAHEYVSILRPDGSRFNL